MVWSTLVLTFQFDSIHLQIIYLPVFVFIVALIVGICFFLLYFLHFFHSFIILFYFIHFKCILWLQRYSLYWMSDKYRRRSCVLLWGTRLQFDCCQTVENKIPLKSISITQTENSKTVCEIISFYNVMFPQSNRLHSPLVYRIFFLYVFF